MKPRRAQRRSFELSLTSELCPNPRSFRLLNAPRAFRCSVPKDSIWDGPRGGRSVIFDSRTCACRVSVSPGEGFRLSSHFEASFPPSKKAQIYNLQSHKKKKLALGHGGVPLSLDRMHLHLRILGEIYDLWAATPRWRGGKELAKTA